MLARSPTSLDVYLAAHILLFADPPFPDALLQVQLCESYPGLVEHARRIQEAAKRAPPYDLFTASESLLSLLIPRSFSGSGAQTQVDPEDTQYRRRTLLFVLGTMAMTAAYIFTHVRITYGPAEDSETDNEDGENEARNSDEGDKEEELAAASGSEPFTDVGDDD